MDDDNQVWPPPPGSGYEPPVKPHRFRWMLKVIGPVFSGTAGAVLGAVLLPAILLVLIVVTNDPGSLIGFLVALVLAAAVGAGAGFLCGLMAWFIGKAVLRWWQLRYLRTK